MRTHCEAGNLRDKMLEFDVVGLLIVRLNDKDPHVCQSTLNAITKLAIHGKVMISSLIPGLPIKRGTEDLRGKMLEHDVMGRLSVTLRDKVGPVRQSVLHALVEFSKHGKSLFFKAAYKCANSLF